MLVLSRRKGEAVVLFTYGPGGKPQPVATLTVVEIRGDKVRLGFEADESLKIARTEVLDRPPRLPKGTRE